MTSGTTKITTTFRLEFFHSTEDSVRHKISFLSEGEGEDILRRFIGHLILANMPEEGIDETLTTLKDIFEFNVEKINYQLPEPFVVRSGSGKVVSVSKAPDLIIEE